MRRRAMRQRLLASGAVIGLMAVIGACGGGDDDDANAGDDGGGAEETADDTPVVTRPRPTTPAGTAPPAATTTELLELLPKAGDIGPLQLGIPSVAAIRSMTAEVSQDPTGPCGAPLEPLTLDGAAGRTYDTIKGRIIGIIVPRDAAVDAHVEAAAADLTEGCASHATTARDGSEITLSGPAPVDISATAPDGVAWIATVEQPADGGSQATVILPAGDNTVVVTMVSPEAIDPALVQAIAEVWFAKATAA